MANDPSGTGRSPALTSTVVEKLGPGVVGVSAAAVVVLVLVVVAIDVADWIRPSGLLLTDPSLPPHAASVKSSSATASGSGCRAFMWFWLSSGELAYWVSQQDAAEEWKRCRSGARSGEGVVGRDCASAAASTAGSWCSRRRGAPTGSSAFGMDEGWTLTCWHGRDRSATVKPGRDARRLGACHRLHRSAVSVCVYRAARCERHGRRDCR